MNIKDEIIKRTEEEVEHLIARAKRIKEREIEMAQRRKEELLQKERGRIDEKLRMLRRKELAKLELEYKLKYLSERDQIIEDFLQSVKAELGNLRRHPKYLNFLLQNIRTAIEQMESMGAKIYLNKADVQLVPKIKQIFKDVQLIFEEKDIIGGVIIESLDGKVNYNVSLEALLDANFEGIKEEILEELGDG